MSLSDKDLQILEAMEQNLADDPKFVNSMSLGKHKLGFNSGRNVVIGILGIIAGLCVLCLGIQTHMLIGVAGFAIMLVGGSFIVASNEHIKAEKPKSAFMQNLEDKWEERLRRERQ